MVEKKSTCNRSSTPKKTLKENRQGIVYKSARFGNINTHSKQNKGTGPRDNYK